MSVARGKIRDKEFALILRDYTQLRYGKITPMDIDGFIDFHGKGFVYWELKYQNTKVPFGQRLALERICDTCEAAGVKTIVAIVSHDVTPNDNKEIEAYSCKVREYRYLGRWRVPKKETTLKDVTDRMEEIAGIETHAQ